MIRFATAFALLLAGTALASAQTLDDEASAFIGAPGFVQQDIEALEAALLPQWLNGDGISPGGLVGPLEKAVLIATGAIPSTRTRTAISYGEIIEDDNGAPLPVSFIEVRHYNLGPAIRLETADAYGEENTADAEEFGLGEHQAWRFIFQPVMGNAAVLIDASSRVISEKEASKQDCTGRPCLDLYSGFDDIAEWQEIEGNLLAWPLLFPERIGGITSPALAISQLAVLGFWANVEGGQYQWTGGEHPEAARGAEPYRFIGIDRNLGQELFIDTIWRETHLNDHAVSSITFRHLDVAGYISLMRASEAR